MSVKIESYSKFKKFYTAPKLISRYPFVQIQSTTSVSTKSRYTVYMHSVPSLSRNQHEQVLQNFRQWVLFQNSTPNVHSVRHIFIKIQDEMEGNGSDLTSRRYYLVVNNIGRSIRKVNFAGKKTAFSPIEIGKIHHWFLRCLLVLKFLHSKNFLHLNIHPGSIFLDKDERIMLGVPGCAYKFIDPDLLAGDENLEDYLAPEILDDDIYSERCDVFALACVFRDVFFGDKMGGIRKEHKARYKKFLELLEECAEEDPDDRVGVDDAISKMHSIVEEAVGPSGKKKKKKPKPKQRKMKEEMEIEIDDDSSDLLSDIQKGKDNFKKFKLRSVKPVVAKENDRMDLMSSISKFGKVSYKGKLDQNGYDDDDDEWGDEWEEEGEGVPPIPDFSGTHGEEWQKTPTNRNKEFSGTHGEDWNARPSLPRKLPHKSSYGRKASPIPSQRKPPPGRNRPVPSPKPQLPSRGLPRQQSQLPNRSLPPQQQQQQRPPVNYGGLSKASPPPPPRGGSPMGGSGGSGMGPIGRGGGFLQKQGMIRGRGRSRGGGRVRGRRRGRRRGGRRGGSSFGRKAPAGGGGRLGGRRGAGRGFDVGRGATKLPSRPRRKSPTTISSSRGRKPPTRTVIKDDLAPEDLAKKEKEDLMHLLKGKLNWNKGMAGSDDDDDDDDDDDGWDDVEESWDAKPKMEEERKEKKEEKEEKKEKVKEVKKKEKDKRRRRKEKKKGKKKGGKMGLLRFKSKGKDKSVDLKRQVSRKKKDSKPKKTAGFGKQVASSSSSLPIEAVRTPEPMLEGKISPSSSSSGVFSSLIGGVDDDILPPSMRKKKKKSSSGLFGSAEFWSESLSFSSIFKKDKKKKEVVKIEEEKIVIPKSVHTKEQEGLTKKKNYTTLKLIGQGGQSSVFFVRDNETQMEYTMKRYVSNEDEYNLEVSAMSSFEHANVVRYHDSFEYVDNYGEKNCFVIMEYCKMGDLAKFLRRQKRKKVLNLEIYSRLIGEMLTAIEQLHSKHYVHHDLKPANIFLGVSKTVKLGDFGFCFRPEDLQKGKKVKGGTKKYMHSDQMKGVFAEKYLDYWSLGVILLQMFCKRVVDLKNVEKEEERESVINEAFRENEQVQGYESLRELIMTCFGVKKEKKKGVEISEIMGKWDKFVNTELEV